MLRAVGSAGWSFISKRESALAGVRTGQAAEGPQQGESSWQRQDVDLSPGVNIFLSLTFSWDKRQGDFFLFSDTFLNKTLLILFLLWDS